MVDITDVELMAQISSITTQAKQAIAAEAFTECEQLLIQRQVLIEQLVILADPAQYASTHTFLTQLMTDDQAQVNSLNQSKSALESQQVTTKRSAKSINRYLAIKQF